ncbi:protein-tyrosine phosphatase-like protein [Sporodiniella umbellata]|nr:protein-tyrosine phosphatase-like protein [Sporodiniella umbellata]
MLSPPTYNKVQKLFLNPPTYVSYNNKRFLILDTPSISNMSRYLKEFERWNVTDVVRCCKAAYSQQLLTEQGIQVHDWFFSDGEFPSNVIIDEWLNLIDARFSEDDKQSCIAAHCVAGLGRAPILVAIALIEEGMDPLDSVDLIRKHRHGAINNKQLKCIENYKRRRNTVGCCIS